MRFNRLHAYSVVSIGMLNTLEYIRDFSVTGQPFASSFNSSNSSLDNEFHFSRLQQTNWSLVKPSSVIWSKNDMSENISSSFNSTKSREEQTFFSLNSSFSVQDSQSSNRTDRYSSLLQVSICILLCLLTAATAVGNIFVIAAIWLDKNLQSAQNCLVLSLAMADLTVALLVMPLATAYEVRQRWILGSELCTFWTLVDVFSCTASILHLLAIALDR